MDARRGRRPLLPKSVLARVHRPRLSNRALRLACIRWFTQTTCRRSPARPMRRGPGGRLSRFATAFAVETASTDGILHAWPRSSGTRPGKSHGGWERRWTSKRSTGAISERAFIVRATSILGTSLDVKTTLRDVSRLVVPQLGDWCAVDLLDAHGKLERVAVEHVEPSKVALAWEIRNRAPPNPSDVTGSYQVMRSRRAEYHAAGLEPSWPPCRSRLTSRRCCAPWGFVPGLSCR